MGKILPPDQKHRQLFLFFSWHQNISPIITHWHPKWLVPKFSQSKVNWIWVLPMQSQWESLPNKINQGSNFGEEQSYCLLVAHWHARGHLAHLLNLQETGLWIFSFLLHKANVENFAPSYTNGHPKGTNFGEEKSCTCCCLQFYFVNFFLTLHWVQESSLLWIERTQWQATWYTGGQKKDECFGEKKIMKSLLLNFWWGEKVSPFVYLVLGKERIQCILDWDDWSRCHLLCQLAP